MCRLLEFLRGLFPWPFFFEAPAWILWILTCKTAVPSSASCLALPNKILLESLGIFEPPLTLLLVKLPSLFKFSLLHFSVLPEFLFPYLSHELVATLSILGITAIYSCLLAFFWPESRVASKFSFKSLLWTPA